MTVSVAGEPLLAFLLASIRIVAWIVVVPPFSSRVFPATAKVILSLALAFAVAPAMTAAQVPLDTGGLLLTVGAQALIGLTMGFVTSLLFAAVAAAGSLVDVFGGFALAQGFDPLSQNMNTVFGKFHQMLATVLLFSTGGHLLVIGGLLTTFEMLPVGDLPELSRGSELIQSTFSLFFVMAVQIALPMIAVLFVADLGLALMTKVAPQLNAINVMFPAKIGLTLLLIGFSFPVLPGAIRRLVELSMAAMAQVAGGG